MQSNERPHVLVVTDDPGLSEFLSEGLPLGGFWTSVIANGLQALEVFRLRQFDLVTVDGDMESFDAIEFLRRLRGVSPLDTNSGARTEAPVLLIVPQSGAPDETGRKALGIAAVMHPPLQLEEVARELHAIFRDWRKAHPGLPLADSANLRSR